MAFRVAVIGAGSAGLCALRHFTARPRVFKAVAFEQGSRVGGTWLYTDQTGTDDFGLPIHSSMYRNLRTNLPKEVMAFPDFPFDANLPSFIRHQDVFAYLEDYAYNFNLMDNIQFSSYVEKVNPVRNAASPTGIQWEVTHAGVASREYKTTDIFDAVVVCIGHYSVPLIPKIPGLEDYKGKIIHSHDYRDPAPFSGMRVACLGAGASGQDIAIDISSTAKQVYLSHRKSLLTSAIPNNMTQKAGIKKLHGKTVTFDGGEEMDIDCLLLCTGYRFHYPFLTKQVNLQIDDDERVTPLYKHLIHTEYPSLFFIGLCKIICPFPQFHVQMQVVTSVLDGTLKLPSKEEMDADTENDFKSRLQQGLPRRHAHFMGPMQWAYNDDLAKMAKCSPVPQSVRLLYEHIHKTRVQNLLGYKKQKFELVGTDSFKLVEK